MTNIKTRYREHRHSAEQRGIAFRLTFDEWLAIWTASGRLAERGRAGHEFVMARHGDIGAYENGNVKIITKADNVREGRAGFGNSHNLGRHHTAVAKGRISAATTGRPPTAGMTGQRHTAEARANISAAKRNISDETRAKMSASAKARCAKQKEAGHGPVL